MRKSWKTVHLFWWLWFC